MKRFLSLLLVVTMAVISILPASLADEKVVETVSEAVETDMPEQTEEESAPANTEETSAPAQVEETPVQNNTEEVSSTAQTEEKTEDKTAPAQAQAQETTPESDAASQTATNEENVQAEVPSSTGESLETSSENPSENPEVNTEAQNQDVPATGNNDNPQGDSEPVSPVTENTETNGNTTSEDNPVSTETSNPAEVTDGQDKEEPTGDTASEGSDVPSEPTADPSEATDAEENAELEEDPEEVDVVLDDTFRSPPLPLDGISVNITPNFKVSAYTYNTVTLSWGKATDTDGNDAAGYVIDYSVDSTFSGATTKEVSGSMTSTVVSGLTCGTTYYYRIKAYAMSGSERKYGDYSAFEYRTSPKPPSTLTAAPEGANAIKLNWATVAEANGYYVFRDGVLVYSADNKQTYSWTDNTGLTAGVEYTYRIHSYRLEKGVEIASVDYKEVKCKLSIPTPQNLVAEGIDTQSILLTWDVVAGADYYVIRRNAGSGFVEIGRTSGNVGTYLDTDSIILGKEYDYNVTAYTANGEHSDPSTPVNGIATFPAPKNFKAKYQNATSIKISWDAVPNADGYCLEASSTKTGTYTKIYESTDNSYTETGLAVGAGRYYRVKAYVVIGSKVYGNESTAVYEVTRPDAPENFTVKNASSNSILVSWDPVPGASGYYLYRRLHNGSYNGPYKDLTATSFLDNNLASGTAYWYYVKPYVTDGSGTKYPGADVPAKYIRVKPAGPATVTATPDSSNNQINLSWSALSAVNGYNIYLVKDDNSYEKLGSVLSSVLTYKATNLKRGYEYTFAVSGFSTESGSSMEGDKTESTPVILPLIAPPELECVDEDATSLTVQWKDIKGVTGYKIKVTCEDDPQYLVETTTQSNNFTVGNLTTGYKYNISVQAYTVVNNVEETGPSSTCSGSPTVSRPTGLKARTAYGAFGIHLEWNAVSGANGYIIERATSKTGPFTQVKKVVGATNTDVGDDMTVNEVGDTYFYRVASYLDAMGEEEKSAWSSIASATVLPKKTSAKAASASLSSIQVTWNKVTGVDGYYVYRSTSSNMSSPWVKKLTGDSTVSFTNGDLKKGTRYYYQVAAYKTVSGTEYVATKSGVVSAIPSVSAVTGLSTITYSKLARLSWTKVSGAAGYKVYRADETSQFSEIADVTKNEYWDYGLVCGKTYRFKVAAYIKNGSSKVLGAESAVLTTTAYVRKVSGVTANKVGGPDIVLNWNGMRTADGFEVQVSTSATGPFTTIAKVTGTKTTVSGFTMGEYQYFRVRAYNIQDGSTSYGAWSDVRVGFAAPKAATNLKATKRTKNSITISWTPASGATGAKVFYKKDGDSSYTLAATISSGSVNNYAISGLAPGTKYWIKVRSLCTNSSDGSFLEGMTTSSIGEKTSN